MSRSNLLHTLIFRQSLAYMAFFTLSVLALLGFMYWNTAGFIGQQTDQTIIAEIGGLDEQFRRTGLVGLIHVVRERSRRQRLGLYQLRGPDGRNLGGNLDIWPDEKPDKDGWINFIFDIRLGEKMEPRQARARLIVLPAGHQLLVGHDIQGRFELEQRLGDSLVWAVILTLVLGLSGGVLLSRGWLTRLDAINQTSREIMAGDLGRRIPLTGKDDELDLVARNLNAMLAQIQELLESLSQVTDNVAHDLRSPLNRMRGHFEVALLEDRTPHEYRDSIIRGVSEINELLSIFNALLSVAEVESGVRHDDLIDTDLGELADDLAELYAPAMEERGIAFEQEIETGMVIRANPRLISQALANLLENALKYLSASGTVRLLVRSCAEGTEAVIVDNGPGIPAHERANVLKRFYRLDNTRQSPGSGLGLSLAAAVARIHGADFFLENANPGLRVVIRFPVQKSPGAINPENSTPGGSEKEAPRLTSPATTK